MISLISFTRVSDSARICLLSMSKINAHNMNKKTELRQQPSWSVWQTRTKKAVSHV